MGGHGFADWQLLGDGVDIDLLRSGVLPDILLVHDVLHESADIGLDFSGDLVVAVVFDGLDRAVGLHLADVATGLACISLLEV